MKGTLIVAGDMKSIRLFFDDSNDGSGHLAVISKENHYKVLHFHCGGLKKISKILQTLNIFILTTTNSTTTSKGSYYEHFQICQYVNLLFSLEALKNAY